MDALTKDRLAVLAAAQSVTCNDGVLYLLYGTKHDVDIVVSLMSLRDHWNGPVCIAAGDEPGEKTARACEADERLGPLEVIRWDVPQGPRGQIYANKTQMQDLSPFDRTVFLDADTVVLGNFNELFPARGTDIVTLTQFAQWRSNGKIRGRLEKWRDVANTEVTRSLAASYPAINTGVLGFTRTSNGFFAAWREMVYRNLSFICDEIACQLMFLDWPHNVLSDRFNWSPIHSASPLEEARIVHGHGRKFVKHPRGRAVWWPYYERALAANIAQLREWTPGGNKRLREYLDTEQQ